MNNEQIKNMMTQHMTKWGIPEKRIIEIVAQDNSRFKETYDEVIKLFTGGSILDISVGKGWEATFGSILTEKGFSDVNFFGDGDVRDKWDIESDSYNMILAMEIFEHLIVKESNRDKNMFDSSIFFLKECKRVLKPRGILILTTPNVCSIQRIRDLMENRPPYYHYHWREYSFNSLKYLIDQSNLELVELKTISHEFPDKDKVILDFLKVNNCSLSNRGKHLLAVCKKK